LFGGGEVSGDESTLETSAGMALRGHERRFAQRDFGSSTAVSVCVEARTREAVWEFPLLSWATTACAPPKSTRAASPHCSMCGA
jgi:hypothetical protein